MSSSLNIGVLAYGLTPGLVFVRIPNERGRWLLVDRAVVEVDCPACGAITGEPCRHGGYYNYRRRDVPPECIKYGVGVHVDRKNAAKRERWPHRHTDKPRHKIRLTPSDYLGEAET